MAPDSSSKRFFLYHNFGYIYKLYVFLGLFLISVFFLWFTQKLIRNIKENDKRYIRIFSQISVLAPRINDEILNVFFENVKEGITFPVIVSDAEFNPVFYRNIKLPKDSTNIIPYLKKRMEAMDVENIPQQIEISIDSFKLIQYLHYGESSIIDNLKWYSVELIIIMASFFIFGIWLFKMMNQYEQSFIWVGLAKETAHQLGTPVSSLMGWNELLAARHSPNCNVLNIVEQMSLDIERLAQISDRFGKIGSKAELTAININALLAKNCLYFKDRLPQLSRSISIIDHYPATPLMIMGNEVLLDWAIENIIKNAIEAINKDQGVIEVWSELIGHKRILICIKDNGKGIPPNDMKKIFNPGYSSKKIGWGLGLTLVKRIIEEFHTGKVYVKESTLQEGTIVSMEFQQNQPSRE